MYRSPGPRTRSLSRSVSSTASPEDKFHSVKRGREDESKPVTRELQMSDGQSCRGGSKSKAAPSRKEVPLMNAIHRKEELQMYCIMNDGVHTVFGNQDTVKEEHNPPVVCTTTSA